MFELKAKKQKSQVIGIFLLSFQFLGFLQGICSSKMAGAKGLEPSAFCVTGRRYNQLNYAPILLEYLM